MKYIKLLSSGCALAVILTAPVSAQDQSAKPSIAVNEDFGVPVFPDDITDKPYVIVAGLEAGVRKATMFSKAPSQKKIYNELWERAKKAGADAVVMAAYGDSKISAMSWGRTSATGVAVRFLTTDELAAGKTPEKAADFDKTKHKMID